MSCGLRHYQKYATPQYSETTQYMEIYITVLLSQSFVKKSLQMIKYDSKQFAVLCATKKALEWIFHASIF